MVERPLCDREVVGSIPGRVIPKTLKMVLAASDFMELNYTLCGTTFYPFHIIFDVYFIYSFILFIYLNKTFCIYKEKLTLVYIYIPMQILYDPI